MCAYLYIYIQAPPLMRRARRWRTAYGPPRNVRAIFATLRERRLGTRARPRRHRVARDSLTNGVQRFPGPVRGAVRVFGLDRSVAQQRVGHQTVVQHHVRIRPAVAADQPIGRVLRGPQRVAQVLRNHERSLIISRLKRTGLPAKSGREGHVFPRAFEGRAPITPTRVLFSGDRYSRCAVAHGPEGRGSSTGTTGTEK